MVFCGIGKSQSCPFFSNINTSDSTDGEEEESTNTSPSSNSSNKNLLEILFLPYKKKNLFDDNLSRTTHSTFGTEFDDPSISSNENENSTIFTFKPDTSNGFMKRNVKTETKAKTSYTCKDSGSSRLTSSKTAKTWFSKKTSPPLTQENMNKPTNTEHLVLTPFTIFFQDDRSICSSLMSLGTKDCDRNCCIALGLEKGDDCDDDTNGELDDDDDANGDGYNEFDNGDDEWQRFENLFTDGTNFNDTIEEMSVLTCATTTSSSLAILVEDHSLEENDYENDHGDDDYGHAYDYDDKCYATGTNVSKYTKKRPTIEPEGELYEPERDSRTELFPLSSSRRTFLEQDITNDTSRTSPITNPITSPSIVQGKNDNIDSSNSSSSSSSSSINEKDDKCKKVKILSRTNPRILLKNNRFPHPSRFHQLNLNSSEENDEGMGKSTGSGRVMNLPSNNNNNNNNVHVQQLQKNGSQRNDPKRRRRFRLFFFRKNNKTNDNDNDNGNGSQFACPSSREDFRCSNYSNFSSSISNMSGKTVVHLDSTALLKFNKVHVSGVDAEPVCKIGNKAILKQNVTSESTNISSTGGERPKHKKRKLQSFVPSVITESTCTASSFSSRVLGERSNDNYTHSHFDTIVTDTTRNIYSREKDLFKSLTASFMQNTVGPTIHVVQTQFKGRHSKRSKIVNRVLHSHDNLRMESIKFSILDEEDNNEDREIRGDSSISSLRAETDAPIVVDPFARPSKRMKKACNHLSGDGDVWVEKIMKNKNTGRRRSFFYSMKTGERTTDEPPSGASTVIFSSTSPDPGRSKRRRWKPTEEIQGDDDLWIEKIQIDQKTDKETSFFYSTKTGFRHVDEPPTGASKILYTTDNQL